MQRVFKTKEKKKTGVTHDLGFEYLRTQFQDCLGTQSPFSVVVVVVCVVVSLYATRAGVPHRSPRERERDGDRREEERRRKKTSAKETGGEVRERERERERNKHV